MKKQATKLNSTIAGKNIKNFIIHYNKWLLPLGTGCFLTVCIGLLVYKLLFQSELGEVSGENLITKKKHLDFNKLSINQSSTPRFEFYNTLQNKSADNNLPKPPEVRYHYLLQAGSFANPEAADTLKAFLILNGLEPSLEKIIIENQTWYRVILGPFQNKQEATNQQKDLETLAVNKVLLIRQAI